MQAGATAERRCDLFCRVVDNLGDIGVCWRLARQLHDEFAIGVRLFLDDFASLARIEPRMRGSESQTVNGIQIRHWHEAETCQPAPWVIEAFACALPDGYLVRLPDAPRVWLNLEYLSAETWVASHHGLPSRHPHLGIDKYFFFPGFSPATGGLIRERGLLAAHTAYLEEQGGALATAPRVLAFAYANAPLAVLAEAVRQSGGQLDCIGMAAAPAPASLLPMVPQTAFDELLWRYDILLVRGEDSFVRAQWAAKPFVWQIYPQADNAHHAKLQSFLDRYTADLDAETADIVRQLWWAWNDQSLAERTLAAAWLRFCAVRGRLAAHAADWCRKMAEMPDLATNLVTFCAARDKM